MTTARDRSKTALRFALAMMLAVPAVAFAQEAEVVQAGEGGLEAAYKREYALVARQKAELEKRLAEFEARAGREVGGVRGEIDALEGTLLSVKSQAGALEDAVVETESMVRSRQDNQDLLGVTFSQAALTLSERGRTALEDEAFAALDDGRKIEAMVAETTALLVDLGDVRTREGAFYLADGSETTGTIVEVGAVASLGVSSKGSGVLAPAGGGALRLWEQPAGDVAEALVAGRAPESLKLFLYESLARPVDVAGAETALEHVQSGGTIAWVIVLLGAIALVMIALRFAFLLRASVATDKLALEVGRLVQGGDVSEAIELCRSFKNAASRVISAALRNLSRDREHLEDIISESILHEREHLNRFGSLILAIAAVAPLLGLLGTVTGMISTFDVITKFGTGDPKLLSGGIATALVTTELGLIVAIPTLMFGTLLSGWAERIKDDMERGALHVTNLYMARTASSPASERDGSSSGVGLAPTPVGA